MKLFSDSIALKITLKKSSLFRNSKKFLLKLSQKYFFNEIKKYLKIDAVVQKCFQA